MTDRPWDRAELAWAHEASQAGDTLAEMAEASDRDVMDVARALGVAGWAPRSRRWRASRRGVRASPWVGGMLKEVAVARNRAGEAPADLAAVARVHVNTMRKALVGHAAP